MKLLEEIEIQPEPTPMRVKRRKNRFLKFIGSGEFQKYVLVLSRKRLAEGNDHYGEVAFHAGEPSRYIIINPYNGNLATTICTIIHEILHIMNPKSKEKNIAKWELEIFNDLAPTEISVVLSLAFKNIVWDE
mgnify:CR=1 FL=1